MNNLRARIRRKRVLEKIKQIHLEHYFFDDVWFFIRNFPYPQQVTWYVMTPANSDYFKVLLGLDVKQVEPKMSERLQWMKREGYLLGVHIHFYRRGDMEISKMRQLINQSKLWGLKNEVDFKKLVPGWFNYCSHLQELCDEFGLELVKQEPYLHDYDLEQFIRLLRK